MKIIVAYSSAPVKAAQTIIGYPSLHRLLEEEYTLVRVQAIGAADYPE